MTFDQIQIVIGTLVIGIIEVGTLYDISDIFDILDQQDFSYIWILLP